MQVHCDLTGAHVRLTKTLAVARARAGIRVVTGQTPPVDGAFSIHG